MSAIVGRKRELAQLRSLLESDRSEFVAVYGRRRVGKTFLIREAFDYKFTFQHTGILDAPKSEQISEFMRSLYKVYPEKCKHPRTWFDAFHLLEDYLESLGEGKKLLFIDEMPWMDTPRSNFIKALDHFWNGWATMRKDIVLIICGSATSWIIDNVINNYGGLHNRLTGQIYLRPFNLNECEEFCKNANLEYTRRQILEAYMAVGGVPFYWTCLKRGQSIAQNFDRMFFSAKGELTSEFVALYRSLFRNPTPHLKIITALAKKKIGLTREEVLKATELADNSTFIDAIKELIQCDFIRKYTCFGKSSKDALYQLTDNYTLFYFKFVKENTAEDTNFWSANYNTSVHNTWSGLSFEMVCLQHIEQIKRALGISGVICHAYSWTHKATNPDDSGAQIDLLIDRNDDVINLCEMKYSIAPYTIDDREMALLQNRKSTFLRETATRKSILLTMITTYGLTPGGNSYDISSSITMDDLFAPSL